MKIPILILILISACGFRVFADSNMQEATARLARNLAEEGDNILAAVEFRRLALNTDKEQSAGYYWASAYQYWHAPGHNAQTAAMLDMSENKSDSIFHEIMLLRAENAANIGNLDEAVFYLETLYESLTDSSKAISLNKFANFSNYTILKLADVRLKQKKIDASEEKLKMLPEKIRRKPLAALRTYREEKDKSPTIGGILGLIPGLGYAYSGEYENALRSLILNGLFIYAMSDTAANDQWGAFTALSFFELTWYSGSIYGGIDAAQRYNKKRFNTCSKSINSLCSFQPDFEVIPVISLNFTFGNTD